MFGTSYTFRTREHADNFFAVPYSRFSTSKANTPLNKEKKKFTRQLQAEINSNLSVIQGIDNQIAQLQSRRAKLSEILETKKGFVAKLSVDEQVGNGKTTNEIELNSEKPEWKMKKENAGKQKMEILAKVDPANVFAT